MDAYLAQASRMHPTILISLREVVWLSTKNDFFKSTKKSAVKW
jgi:hypothetical protein